MQVTVKALSVGADGQSAVISTEHIMSSGKVLNTPFTLSHSILTSWHQRDPPLPLLLI